MFELHRHIEILLLKHSCVIVPGFGGFMAHHVSARFDESDGTMIPPMRTVGFNPQLTLNDSLLVQSYIEAYDISYPEALRLIESEVAELRLILERDRYFDISSVGRLYINDYGQYEFEPCVAGILTPSFYGLPCVEINKYNTLSSIQETPVIPIVNNETIEEDPQGDINYIDETDESIYIEEDTFVVEEETSKVVALPWGKLAVACLLLLIAFATPFALKSNIVHDISMSGFNTEIFSRFIPSELLSFESNNSNITATETNKTETPTNNITAITPEKAENKNDVEVSDEIITENTPVEIVLPEETVTENNNKKEEPNTVSKIEKTEKNISKEKIVEEKKTVEEKKAVKKEEIKKEEIKKTEQKKIEQDKPEEKVSKKTEEPVKPVPAKKNPVYTIVLASSINPANADNYVNNLHNRGYIAARTYSNGQQVRVVHGRYASYVDAQQVRESLSALPEFEQCWILEIPQ